MTVRKRIMTANTWMIGICLSVLAVIIFFSNVLFCPLYGYSWRYSAWNGNRMVYLLAVQAV